MVSYSDFKMIKYDTSMFGASEVFAEVLETNRSLLFWKPVNKRTRKIHRARYSIFFRFIDDGDFCPSEIDQMLAAWEAQKAFEKIETVSVPTKTTEPNEQ